MTFKVALLAFGHHLFNTVSKFTVITTIKSLTIKKHRLINPLAAFFGPIIDRKTKLGNFATITKGSNLRIPGQSANKHYFVEVRHGATAPVKLTVLFAN
jgi:hypothetical protein